MVKALHQWLQLKRHPPLPAGSSQPPMARLTTDPPFNAYDECGPFAASHCDVATVKKLALQLASALLPLTLPLVYLGRYLESLVDLHCYHPADGGGTPSVLQKGSQHLGHPHLCKTSISEG